MKRFAGLVLSGLVGCATVPRLVTPLQYAPSPAAPPTPMESAFAARPLASAPKPVACLTPVTASLANGLRLVVAERHAFPTVSVRLVIRPVAMEWDDIAAVRLQLMADTYFPVGEVDDERRVSCSRAGCVVNLAGTAPDLDDLLLRLRLTIGGSSEAQGVLERRLRFAVAAMHDAERFAVPALIRNVYAAALGQAPYGYTSRTDFSVDEMDSLRRIVMRPDNATLIVAGDASLDQVRSAAEREFGGWVAKGPPPPRATWTGSGQGPPVVVLDVRAIAQPWGAVVLRGPSRGSADAAPFALAAQMLGGGATSTAFHHVREELTAAYVVGGNVDWLGASSVFLVGAQMAPSSFGAGVSALVAAVRDLRVATPDPDRVQRAKAALGARAREQAGTSAGLAAAVATSVLAGGPVDPCEFARQVDAVTAQAVQRVASHYFSEDNLHVVALGPADSLSPPLRQLGLGDERLRDGTAHDVEPPRSTRRAWSPRRPFGL